MIQENRKRERSDNPEISIVIPMYNVELYIEECLCSLLEQTFEAFEIICIDDGSTDNTADIVREFMDRDKRLLFFEYPHCGRAGIVRNVGIEKTRGKYLLFLDGDDFFEKDMLEKAISKIKKDDADICIFGARKYIEKTKEFIKYDALNPKYIPDKLPFAGKDNPYIFNMCSATPWNKLIKKSLVEEWQIRFMPLRRSNDVYFVRFATAVAQRITVLNEVFVNYRQSSGSLQATNDKTPLDWFEALCELKLKLQECGLYDNLEQSFINYSLSLGFYHLNTLKQTESFYQLYDKLKYDLFPKLGVLDYDVSKFYSYNDKKCAQLIKLKKYTGEEYLFQEFMECKEEETCLKKRCRQAEQEIKLIKESTEFKIGKVLLFIPGKVKAMLKGEQ